MREPRSQHLLESSTLRWLIQQRAFAWSLSGLLAFWLSQPNLTPTFLAADAEKSLVIRKTPHPKKDHAQLGSSAEDEKLSRGLLSLRLMPQEAALWGNRASQQMLVLGTYADGLERDLTSHSKLSVSEPKSARVDQRGRISVVADGHLVLTAEFAGRTAKASILVEGTDEKRAFSFPRDIGGILTKRGCNSSGCHGGVKGQGGFKLSGNALYPREDYKWIFEGGTYQVLSADSSGPKIPRIDLKSPEKSLLLLKPTMVIPHGGGQRFETDSEDYLRILDWVRSGALYGEDGVKDAPQVTRIQVFPENPVLSIGASQQLLVTAFLSNGRQEDFTHQVSYVLNDTEVASVTIDGAVTGKNPGETDVLIRSAGHAISARIGVIAKSISNYPGVARRNFIDDEVFSKLKKFNIVPSELSTDSEFLRRVCLDLTGTLPPPERVREFLASKDSGKREILVETLLKTPEYIDYWTFRFADLFRVALFPAGGNPKWSQAYWEWIRESVSQNKPYDQIAQERLAAQGYSGASRHYLPYAQVGPPENTLAEEVRVFMGRRLDCAQCHNHPYESWSQDQFWGMTAFFGRLNFIGRQLAGDSVIYDDPAGQEITYGDVNKSKKILHPRTKEEVQPTFLDGTVLPEEKRSDLRMELAKWITSHPYFAEAAVNRIWGYFFGRGIVQPVDDFRSTNPPSHPELLKKLAQDFKEHRFDLKHLIRRILNSRTYQLSSFSNETNRNDRINYSHALSRPLDGEILLDAISSVTEIPNSFSIRVAGNKGGVAPFGTRAINLKEPDMYESRFLEIYGCPIRLSVPERKVTASLAQALHLLAGSTYSDKLLAKGGRLEKLINSGSSSQEIIRELYLTALSRFPAEGELSQLESMISRNSSRDDSLQSLLWALVSSREFSENH